MGCGGGGAVLAVGSRLSVLAGGAVLAVLPVFAIGTVLPVLAVFAVGTDGVALRVSHQLAVQRPIPVAIGLLGQAYLRGVAVGAGVSLIALFTLVTCVTLFSLVTFISFLAVVDGDGVAVQELDSVAHLLAALHERGDGGDAVGGVEQLLYGGDVVVGFFLPLFEGGEALLMVVHRVPQGGVVVVVLAGGEQG